MIIPLFPSFIHSFETSGFGEIKNDLVKYAYEIRKQDPEGVNRSNRGGWHSGQRLDLDDNVLKTFVEREVINYIVQNRVFKEGVEWELDGLWFNINKKGHYNRKHVHYCCHMSAVLWIATPEKSGDIEFENPQFYNQAHERLCYSREVLDMYNHYPAYTIPPTEGTMLLFPASLYHSVAPNQTRQDRISASFNLKLYPKDFSYDPS